MSGRFSSLLDALRRFFGLAPRATTATSGPGAPPTVGRAGSPTPPDEPAFDPHALALALFTRLQRSGFNIGVAELLALRRAVAGGWGAATPDDLCGVARLLWCNSRQEQAEFDLQWQTLAAYWADHRTAPPTSGPGAAPPAPAPARDPEAAPAAYAPPESRVLPERHAELAALPVRAPFTPAPVSGDDGLQTYWPLSRRDMVYAWRYLRRPVADGPADVLDVAATVARTARQGFYLAPVYHRRVRNHAHLLLLVDQGGSMTPFHRFTRDLVETAQQESTLEQVVVYYFHNIFDNRLFVDPHRTEAIHLDAALAECDGETSVLLVSDAGAARGRRDRERIRLTALALAELKSRTTLLAWLNPMPRERWRNSSAQMIASLAPMQPMHADGLSNAIDQLRGQG
ncbi:VWA containing CoxE family protein [Caldilinea sp.]|uniref:VWA containing CoxE family protein n=1 Tax=Caldilinea sp. TaxID=2293560 RepID=UPI002C5BCAD3|nr:hypothetical protein [Caldilinea sp.]